jgi:hypothetical protein
LLSLPLAWSANPLARLILPLVEPLYTGLLRITKGAAERLSRRVVAYTVQSDPSVFRGRLKK